MVIIVVHPDYSNSQGVRFDTHTCFDTKTHSMKPFYLCHGLLPIVTVQHTTKHPDSLLTFDLV